MLLLGATSEALDPHVKLSALQQVPGTKSRVSAAWQCMLVSVAADHFIQQCRCVQQQKASAPAADQWWTAGAC